MESVHKPVFIPPKKRVVRKVKGGAPSSSAATSSVRRIHSYDIVTRIQHDDSVSFPACSTATAAAKLSSSKSGSPADLARSRSQSQETFSLSTLSSSPHLALTCHDSPVSPIAGSSTGQIQRPVRPDAHRLDDSITLEVEDDYDAITVCTDDAAATATPVTSPLSVARPDSAEVEAMELATEKCALNHQSHLVLQDGYLTLSGTIKRGKKAGQSIDVKLNMSREELEKMEADLSKKLQPKSAIFGLRSGLHVALLSLLCIPAVFMASGCYVFYLGTFTWYNIYLHYNEERTIWHKVFVCPLLVLTYPVWVAPTFLGIGFYSAVVQISWYYDRWLSEVQDLEKGFFGWLCAALWLSDCAPYEVVILNDIPSENEKVKINERTTTL